MQHNPLISVIIPVFAAEKFIEETINSVVKQSYNNWELIVVNDGSPDNSESIILKLQENESRIQYYSKENTGVSDTRNFGISKARGALIAFLDADDAWLYNKLELQLKAFQDDPTVCWVFGDAWLADELMNYTEYRKGYDNDLLNNLLSWEKDIVPGPSSNIIVKSDCFRQGKISFDSSLSSGADQDITIQLAAKYKGICIPHPLWVYRVLPNSMSKNIKVMERDHLLIFNKAKKQGLFKSTSFEKACFANLYLILGGSFWIDDNNKRRGLYYIFKAVLKKPITLFFLLKKLIK